MTDTWASKMKETAEVVVEDYMGLRIHSIVVAEVDVFPFDSSCSLSRHNVLGHYYSEHCSAAMYVVSVTLGLYAENMKLVFAVEVHILEWELQAACKTKIDIESQEVVVAGLVHSLVLDSETQIAG